MVAMMLKSVGKSKYITVYVTILVLVLVACSSFLLHPRATRLFFAVSNPTPISPLYYVKITRETFQSYFIFGPIDQALWELTLAQKRIEEVRVLKNNHIIPLAQSQLEIAKKHQDTAHHLIDSLRGKTDSNYLETTYSTNQRMIDELSTSLYVDKK